MHRTTLELDENFFKKLKKEALKSNQTLKSYLNQLLTHALSQKETKPFKLEWKTFRGEGVPPVPLEDRDRLFDFMEEK